MVSAGGYDVVARVRCASFPVTGGRFCPYHISLCRYTFTAAETGTLFVTTAGSDIDTVLSVYSKSPSDSTLTGLTWRAGNDDCWWGAVTSCVQLNVTQGVAYALRVGAYDGLGGDITVVVGPAATNGVADE